MAAVVRIVSRHGFTVELHHKTNLLRVSWHCKGVAQPDTFTLSHFKQMYIHKIIIGSVLHSYKSECKICISRHLKKDLVLTKHK